MPRLLAALALLLPASADAAEGFVALVNATGQGVSFRIDTPNVPGTQTKLAAGEVRAVAVGRKPTIRFAPPGKPESRFALDPFAAYAFVPGAGGVGFQGIELAAKLPPANDVPALPTLLPAQKVPVLLACDAAESRTRQAWERRARAVVAEANAVLESQINLTLEVVGVESWDLDAKATDLDAALADLARRVAPGDARLVIGFTPRPLGYKPEKDKPPQFAAVSRPLGEFLVLRESLPKTDSGRAEVLVQAVGKWLGAGGAPDAHTVMRPKLGDGLAGLTQFRVQFDPFNALAVNMVAAELRAGARSPDALPEATRERLRVIYKTLLAAAPADPTTVDAVAALDPADQPKAAPKADARRAAIRVVVTAIRLRAQAISDLPAGERPRGDDLTNDLVRTAAKVAATTDGPQAAALAVGLGIGLDDSTTLRDNLVTRDLARSVETEAEFRERVAALGRPTVRGRRDLCQHFAVSCALTEIVGAKGAELAGLTKELRDLGGASGFSFVDLLADFSGTAFAEKLLADPAELARVQAGFATDARVPPTEGFQENITAKRFETDYGGLSDPRLKAAVAEVRTRVEKHLQGK